MRRRTILASHWGDISNRPNVRHEKCIEALREPVALQSQFPCREIESGIQQSGTSSTFLPSPNAARVLIAISPMTDDRHRDQPRLLGGFSLCGLQKDSLTEKWDKFHGKWLPRDGSILQNRRWVPTLQRHKMKRY